MAWFRQPSATNRTTLAVDFHQQCLSGSINETHGTEIYVKLLARRGRVQLPPALLERCHPGPGQPALDGKEVFPRFFSVVILNMNAALFEASRCIGITIRCKSLLMYKLI